MRFWDWVKRVHTPKPETDPDLVLVAYAMIFLGWVSLVMGIASLVVAWL